MKDNKHFVINGELLRWDTIHRYDFLDIYNTGYKLSIEQQREIIKNPDFRVIISLIRTHILDIEIQNILIKHDNRYVLQVLGRQSYTDVSILKELANHCDYCVRDGVADNFYLKDQTIINLLLNDTYEYIRKAMQKTLDKQREAEISRIKAEFKEKINK